MDATITCCAAVRPAQQRAERGFTLVEVMIAIAITGVAMLTMIGTFGAAMAATQNAQNDLIAKQKALEALESIFTARNTQQIVFAQINNVSNGGIFTDGFTTLRAPGLDGLVGTGDDANYPGCPSGIECVTLPGPDGVLGAGGDDQQVSLAGFTRQILISPVMQPGVVPPTPNPNLRQITINVQYFQNGQSAPRTYTSTALMSSYR
jgi:prepilin-type N-terminal cleavage/methylation domain-containing protein